MGGGGGDEGRHDRGTEEQKMGSTGRVQGLGQGKIGVLSFSRWENGERKVRVGRRMEKSPNPLVIYLLEAGSCVTGKHRFQNGTTDCL